MEGVCVLNTDVARLKISAEAGMRWAHCIVGIYFGFYFLEISLWPSNLIFSEAKYFIHYGAPMAAVLSVGMAVAAFKFERLLGWTALSIWLLNVVFLNLMPAAREIQTSHMNLLLVFFFLSSFSRSRDADLVCYLSRAFMVVYGLSYAYSGLTKAMSTDWVSGKNLLVYFQFVRSDELIAALSNGLKPHLKTMAWLVAIVEISVLPAICWRKTRHIALYLVVLMHIMIGIYSDLVYVSVGMIVYNFAALRIFARLELSHRCDGRRYRIADHQRL